MGYSVNVQGFTHKQLCDQQGFLTKQIIGTLSGPREAVSAFLLQGPGNITFLPLA